MVLFTEIRFIIHHDTKVILKGNLVQIIFSLFIVEWYNSGNTDKKKEHRLIISFKYHTSFLDRSIHQCKTSFYDGESSWLQIKAQIKLRYFLFKCIINLHLLSKEFLIGCSFVILLLCYCRVYQSKTDIFSRHLLSWCWT